jgi:thiamine pyrophosphate-dependent acetolactate synthase large subunit-like protein
VIDRYRAIAKILERVKADDLVLSTTGMISREVFMTDDQPRNFYMLGSMGLLSSFGLGLALLQSERRIWVLEGDGSALMSLGLCLSLPPKAPPTWSTYYWIMRRMSPLEASRP